MLYHSSEKLDRMYEQSKIGVTPIGSDVRAMIAELREHRTARWGIDSCLPRGKASDNAAVDRFAKAMKAKLASARERGRGGWDDPTQCSPAILSAMLHDHVAKGDPVDVANFAMMIEHYGALIAPPSDAGSTTRSGEQVERIADAPEGFYGKIGVAMFQADAAGLRIDQAINFVGNAALAALGPTSSPDSPDDTPA